MATARPDGSPHLVPVVFGVLDGGRVVTAVDDKPKRHQRLQRLDNIRHDERVSLLVDHYDDADWSQLWWVRADGAARLIEAGSERDEALTALATKYPQHRATLPPGPVIVIVVTRLAGWSASG